MAESVLSPKSVYHAQFEELGVIDGRRLHPASWGRVRSGASFGERWQAPQAPSSAGFVYPSAPSSRSQTGCASLPPLPAVRRLEVGDHHPMGLEGDESDSNQQIGRAQEGRQKFPPRLVKTFIAHAMGGLSARISSMTSSQSGLQSDWEGRDEELGTAFCLVCDFTMNSWVFGRISLVTKVCLYLLYSELALPIGPRRC